MVRIRKSILPIVLALAVLGGLVAILPPLVLPSTAQEHQVASIKSEHEYQDPTLLQEAWDLPVAKLYRANIEYQRNASVCGPTSLVNVARTIGEKANDETVLQDTGIATFMGYLPRGITLDQLAEIARRKLNRKVTILRDLDIATFREHLRHANDLSRRYVINFSRRALFETGGGHHSPIAGYLAKEDLILVLDVNEKYGPWLVKPERLLDAMNTVDSESNKKRGLLLIE